MNTKTILIVLGEPNSTFLEVLFKYFKSSNFKNNKKKIILIGSKQLVEKQMKILKYKIKINEIDNIYNFKHKFINIINVNYNFSKAFTNITSNSNDYIENCFDLAIKLIKKNNLNMLINGPVSKTHFLQKRFPGITEYVGFKTKTKQQTMLIYNSRLSVCPLTTHIPIKNVAEKIKKKKLINTVSKINSFYKSKLKKKT